MAISRNINIRKQDKALVGEPFGRLLNFNISGQHFFYIFDIADSEYEWFSASISDVIGYEVDELCAMLFINNIHPDDKQPLADIIVHLEDLADEYGPEWLSHFNMMYDFRFCTKAGNYICLLVQMVQQYDRVSARYKRYGRMTDITYFKNEGHTTFSMMHMNDYLKTLGAQVKKWANEVFDERATVIYENENKAATQPLLVKSWNPDIKITEASEFTGLNVNTLYGLVSRKAIPFYKVGGSLRFSPTELQLWVENGRLEIIKVALKALRR